MAPIKAERRRRRVPIPGERMAHSDIAQRDEAFFNMGYAFAKRNPDAREPYKTFLRECQAQKANTAQILRADDRESRRT